MNQTCNWEHTLLYFNGSHRMHTHDWQGGNSRWRDSTAQLIYPLAANQQFWARAWNGCWSNWTTSRVPIHRIPPPPPPPHKALLQQYGPTCCCCYPPHDE